MHKNDTYKIILAFIIFNAIVGVSYGLTTIDPISIENDKNPDGSYKQYEIASIDKSSFVDVYKTPKGEYGYQIREVFLNGDIQITAFGAEANERTVFYNAKDLPK